MGVSTGLNCLPVVSGAVDCHYTSNPYINIQGNCYNDDRCLYDKLTAEMINTFGWDIVYFQTTSDIKYDPIFQEDPTKRMIRKFSFRLFYQLPTRARQYTKWGIELTESVIGTVSKESFKINIGTYDTTTKWWENMGMTEEEVLSMGVLKQTKPKIGDLIYLKDNDTYYEVVDVDDRQGENELNFGHAPVWYIYLKVMKDDHLSYISETVKTTINDGEGGVIPIKVADSETQSGQNLNDFFDIKKPVSEEMELRKVAYEENDLTVPVPPVEQSKPFTPYADSLSKTNGKNQQTEDEYLKEIGWY